MKKVLKICILLSISLAGCSTASISMYEDQFSKGVKPLVGNSPEEQKIELSVPIYKF